MNIFGFDFDKQYEYENGFYLTSRKERLGKVLAHYELYKMISHLPGVVVETGVFKAASFVRWLTFRDILENEQSRKVIGFDTFDTFPETGYEDDQTYREQFIAQAGDRSLSCEELEKILSTKRITNYDLVAGDINNTVPEYIKRNPHLKVALLHIDTDIYEPAKTAFEYIYPRMVKGGIIVLDDYGLFPGETEAADEFARAHNLEIKKLPQSQAIPAYIVV